MTQQDLFSFRAPPSGPDSAILAHALRGRGWTGGAELALRLSWPARRIRQAASDSKGEVLSGPGSPGYCLTREADPEQVEHYAKAHKAQARAELRRYVQITKFYHGYCTGVHNG